MIAGFDNGRKSLFEESSTLTGSMGEYELRASPGDHVIRATRAESAASYYPSTADPNGAKAVHVGNGEQVRDFNVSLIRTFAVSGRITNGTVDGGEPTILAVSRTGTQKVFPAARYSPDPGGGIRFELEGLPSGPWDLIAVTGSGMPNLHHTGKTGIQVSDKNIEGMTITFGTIDVRGSIKGLEGESATVELVPIYSVPAPLSDAVPALDFVSADGTFTFVNVPSMQYRVEVHGLLPEFYVADIRVGGKTILDDNVVSIDTESPDPIEIRVSRGSGTVQGTVLNIPANTRLSNARVVLVPEPSRRGNVSLYRTAPIQENGNFSIFPRVAPGNYTIFAVSNLPSGHAEWNVDFLSRYADVALPITVAPNQSVQAKVEWMRTR